MPSPDLAGLVGAAYDAAGGALSWNGFGRELCRVAKADRAYIGLPQPDGTLPNLLHAGDPMDDAYARVYHRIDPFRSLAAAAPPGARRVRRGTEILLTQDIRRSAYVADYARRRRTPHSIGGQIDERGQHLLGLFRGRAAFDDAELGLVGFLLPHSTARCSSAASSPPPAPRRPAPASPRSTPCPMPPCWSTARCASPSPMPRPTA